MNKKLIGVFGILFLLLSITITVPADTDNDTNNILAEKKIIAIGSFSHCEVDEEIYGWVLFGFLGLQPLFNTEIHICDESIQNIVITDFFLYCVYYCEG